MAKNTTEKNGKKVLRVAPDTREFYKFFVKMNETEKNMMLTVCERTGLKRTELVRNLIREKYDKLNETPPAPPKDEED